ncbi:MAG: Crp/Fnr family transcriptional regulator [Spirochaetaceae bacterium]|nr:Crp/Fnr family transcriptional regulator [Spirochaetaceae bacterium]
MGDFKTGPVPSALRACPLFKDMTEADIQKLLSCLSVQRKTFKKNTFILVAGEGAKKNREGGPAIPMGIVLSGSLRMIQNDFWGNRSILGSINPAGFFGGAFSYAQVESAPVSVVAAEKSEVLLFNYKTIPIVCRNACSFHMVLINNLIGLLAKKNVMLIQKLEYMNHRSIREKILAYLSGRALEAGKNRFTIPYNRQELADYLSVDRSALSRELGRLRDQGLLSFRKNTFTLGGASTPQGYPSHV